MKVRFDNPEELAEKINRYFETLRSKDPPLPPTMSGLALFLGVTRKTLTRYIGDVESEAGAQKRKKGRAAECGELLMMAKAQIETYLEEKLVNGYSKGIEFTLMNGYGWGGKSTVDVQGDVEVKHGGEVKTSVTSLSDEELIEQIRILGARQTEILKREGIADGADG